MVGGVRRVGAGQACVAILAHPHPASATRPRAWHVSRRMPGTPCPTAAKSRPKRAGPRAALADSARSRASAAATHASTCAASASPRASTRASRTWAATKPLRLQCGAPQGTPLCLDSSSSAPPHAQHGALRQACRPSSLRACPGPRHDAGLCSARSRRAGRQRRACFANSARSCSSAAAKRASASHAGLV